MKTTGRIFTFENIKALNELPCSSFLELTVHCQNPRSSLFRARVSVSQRWPPFNYRNSRPHITLIRETHGWICCVANLFWGSSFLIISFLLLLILCLFEGLLFECVCICGCPCVRRCTICIQMPVEAWKGCWMPWNRLWTIRYGCRKMNQDHLHDHQFPVP